MLQWTSALATAPSTFRVRLYLAHAPRPARPLAPAAPAPCFPPNPASQTAFGLFGILPILSCAPPCSPSAPVRDVRLRQDQLPPLPSAAPSPAAAQHTASAPTAATAGVVVRGRGKELGAAQLALIAAADTFFIATSYSGGGNRGGARELQVRRAQSWGKVGAEDGCVGYVFANLKRWDKLWVGMERCPHPVTHPPRPPVPRRMLWAVTSATAAAPLASCVWSETRGAAPTRCCAGRITPETTCSKPWVRAGQRLGVASV